MQWKLSANTQQRRKREESLWNSHTCRVNWREVSVARWKFMRGLTHSLAWIIYLCLWTWLERLSFFIIYYMLFIVVSKSRLFVYLVTKVNNLLESYMIHIHRRNYLFSDYVMYFYSYSLIKYTIYHIYE